MPAIAFRPWNLVLVCVSRAIAVAAKSAKEANIASNMDLVVSICHYLLSIDSVLVFAGLNPVISDFKSVIAQEPYNPERARLSEERR